MYKLSDYITKEILKDARIKFLSFIKILFKLGNLNAALLIRIFLLSSHKKNIFSRIISAIARNRLIKLYGIELSGTTKIDIGFNIGHANGIILGEGVEIGKNVTIYQQVTLGISNVVDKGNFDAYPKVGDNCVIYSGAKLFGNIKVGKGTVIGANSVLLTNTEENSVYAGIPAKRIK